MQITERRIGQTVILDLVGELTYANRTAFKAAVERNRQTGCRHVILNMQGVRFLDSSALGMLALRFGKTRQVRIFAWIGAQFVFFYIVLVAVTKNPALFFSATS